MDLGFEDTCLARVGRLVAFTSSNGGMCDAVFIQLFRYPTIDVTSLTTMHAHVVVPTALLSSDELDEQEIFVHLPLHSIQVLHVHMSPCPPCADTTRGSQTPGHGSYVLPKCVLRLRK